MAFQFNAPASNNNAAQNENWKATGFLNIWVRRTDGSRYKIGAVALREQRVQEKALIDRLSKEDGVEALMAAMEVDFQLVNKDPAQVNVGF